ncbi:MAG TPA: GNAT family N-acetyltransferase [Solirubrobacteraceae bacterium]|nr:GNAT family N-acetyltransferase [Solirubrobacteraceae bacterium]
MTPAFREAGAADSRMCHRIFRASLWNYMGRTGYVPAGEPQPDVEEHWGRSAKLFEHLAATAAHWWIAEDDEGRAVGYARSTQRGDVLELTEFFVMPDARLSGVGRGLLERAFPPGAGPHRAIIATFDAPAVALYLRFGVAHQTTFADVAGTPRRVDVPPAYDVQAATLGEVLAMEASLLGHGRPQDVSYMLGDRPGVVLRRDGRPVAYAFGPNAHGFAGPIGALDPADLPAALAYVEHAAFDAGAERLDLTVPLGASTAIDWLLVDRGFRLDPFYALFLADGPWAKLDRYLPFNPCLIL